jgi:hypothetical protein
MMRRLFAVTFALLGWATSVFAQPAISQLPNPRLSQVMPPGGKSGTTFEVTFSGAFQGFQFNDMEEPQKLLFSHKGITAEAIPPVQPEKPDPKAPPPQVTKFKVTIAADVPVGIYDVRLVNKWGISNPRAFVVGDLTEVLEKEPNNDVTEAQRVELNTTISGVINAPTDVDYFVFTGKKDQHIIFNCLSASIDSRLDAAFEIYNAKNKKLLSGRTRSPGTDTLADMVLPEDGDYFVRLFHFTYIGANAEYFYRLSITTGPWIDAVYPPCLEPGKQTQVTVWGRNLPDGKPDPASEFEGRTLEKITVNVTAPNDPVALTRLAFSGQIPPRSGSLDGFEYRIKGKDGLWSNPFLMTYAKAPVVLDNAANDTADTAQKITTPCEIAGQFEKRKDRDWYVFTAKKGDLLNVEAYADRLGAPVDLKFEIRNQTTKALVMESQDNADAMSPQFFARSNDPLPYHFIVPADGDYQLVVKNLNENLVWGPRQYYRIRFTPDIPDFQLIVMPPTGIQPDTCSVPQNGNQHFNVYAWRNDGFTGDITLEIEGLPQGVTCPPQTLAGGMRHGMLVLSAAADAPLGIATVKVKGTATIAGKKVVREARPASVTWPVQAQQGIPTISRVDRELVLAVREPAPFAIASSLDKAVVQQGDKVNLTLKLNRISADLKQPITIATVDTIQGLPVNPIAINNAQPFTIAPDKADGTLVIDVKPTVPPGVYTIALRATAAGFPFTKDPAKPKANISVVLPTAPVTLTVLPKVVATLAVATPNPAVKAGGEAELVIKATRQFDFAGEMKVQLVLPPNVQGITAAEVVIPAGQTEAKLIIKADANVPPGAKPDFIVRATAMVAENVPAVQEVKFALNVTK